MEYNDKLELHLAGGIYDDAYFKKLNLDKSGIIWHGNIGEIELDKLRKECGSHIFLSSCEMLPLTILENFRYPSNHYVLGVSGTSLLLNNFDGFTI